MDLDRLHHAVRSLVRDHTLPAHADLSTAERKAVSTLRRQVAAMETTRLGPALTWIGQGAVWIVSTERARE